MTLLGGGVIVSGGVEEGKLYDDVVELTIQDKGRQYTLAAG